MENNNEAMFSSCGVSNFLRGATIMEPDAETARKLVEEGRRKIDTIVRHRAYANIKEEALNGRTEVWLDAKDVPERLIDELKEKGYEVIWHTSLFDPSRNHFLVRWGEPKDGE